MLIENDKLTDDFVTLVKRKDPNKVKIENFIDLISQNMTTEDINKIETILVKNFQTELFKEEGN